MLTGNQIRESFIQFFKEKDHKQFESSSLIPDDISLLLTVAGMVPFKPYFLGHKEPPCPRVTTFQKCIRTNDLDNVGRTARHHTFFEMLGNFSFGDYFKQEAIVWSYEFVTEVLKIDKDRLWVTVFTTDDEAEKIWIEKCNFPKERIRRMGEEDNWWSAGPTGSCGPCSEIYVDLGIEYGGDENSELGDVGTDDRFIEIWNLVFTEWNRKEDGSLEPLPKKNIDTGAGLERIASVIQNKTNNFETDLLFPILEKASEITGKKYKESYETDFSLKVITDHARAVTFLVNDGVVPSNEGRGYVLRRILRRAVRHGRLLGYNNLFMYNLVDDVVANFKCAYPELEINVEKIKKIVKIEEEKFHNTLDQGIQIVNQEIDKLLSSGLRKLSGEVSFKMYDTYGFPYELTEEIALERGIELSREEFEEKMEEQKTKARLSREVVKEKGQDSYIEKIYDEYGVTKFTGYENSVDTCKLISFRKKDENIYELIFDKTPLYAESGGQVGDKGIISRNGFSANVIDVQKTKDIFLHYIKSDEDKFEIGEEYIISVDTKKRQSIARNHTATHLLHKALREVLGSHIKQAGSLVDEEKLRFDFSHFEAMTEKQIAKVEDIVNEKILDSIEVKSSYHDINKAKEMGAVMLFGDKYGDVVRVIEIPEFSMELCGGVHIDNTGKIGFFKIISESGIASGIRRIEAKTGNEAYKYVKQKLEIIKEVSKVLKTNDEGILEKVEKINENFKNNEREIEILRARVLNLEGQSYKFEEVNGVKILIDNFKDKSLEELKQIVDNVKSKEKDAVIILSNVVEDKINFVAGVTKDLTDKIKAGDLIKKMAEFTDGRGGGRDDFAQGGGKNLFALEKAIVDIKEIVNKLLG